MVRRGEAVDRAKKALVGQADDEQAANQVDMRAAAFKETRRARFASSNAKSRQEHANWNVHARKLACLDGVEMSKMKSTGVPSSGVGGTLVTGEKENLEVLDRSFWKKKKLRGEKRRKTPARPKIGEK
jgi:hypothetical protein